MDPESMRVDFNRTLWGLVVLAALLALAVPATGWASDAFGDVPEGNVHHDAIGAIADAGVTQGCAPGRYCPDRAVQRDEMGSFMARLGGLADRDPVVNAAQLEGVAGQDILDRLAALEQAQDGGDGELADRVESLESTVGTLESDLAQAQSRIAELESTLEGVTRTTTDGHDTLRLEGMNLQVVNGEGQTNSANGLGNLVVGYHEDLTCDPSDAACPDFSDNSPDDRGGSHMVVTGVDHTYTAFGGLLAGLNNTTSGDWTSVSGGVFNTASGDLGASVSGGAFNTASGSSASVSGGGSNTASGFQAVVSGGFVNTADGGRGSVSGGRLNEATGRFSSVTGGRENTASERLGSVTGGRQNTASGNSASVSGGEDNEAAASESSILGGSGETVNTAHSCHPAC